MGRWEEWLDFLSGGHKDNTYKNVVDEEVLVIEVSVGLEEFFHFGCNMLVGASGRHSCTCCMLQHLKIEQHITRQTTFVNILEKS